MVLMRALPSLLYHLKHSKKCAFYVFAKEQNILLTVTTLTNVKAILIFE
jgi:hypothetical protein